MPPIQLLRPLRWPADRPRTPRPRAANFSGDRTLTQAARALHDTLTTKGFVADARDVVITVADGSANPRADVDPGAAVYFTRRGQNFCLPCDRWDYAAHNVWALAQHVSALRAMERWGVGTTDDAFSPYVALPPSPDAAPYVPTPEPDDQRNTRRAVNTEPDFYLRNGGPWQRVLGFHPRARPTIEEIDARFKALAREHHPDAGGSNLVMVNLNTARAEALYVLVHARRRA